MTIIQIQVTAGRTFNHPFESYSNLRPEVTILATLSEAEDPRESVKRLQATAEELVEDHKKLLLTHLEELQQLTEARAQATSLETELRRAQIKLEELRKQYPSAFQQQLLPDNIGQ